MDRGGRQDNYGRGDSNPAYLGSRRLPNGLAFKKRVNETALRALDDFDQKNDRPRSRDHQPMGRKSNEGSYAPRGESRTSDRSGSYGSGQNDRGHHDRGQHDRGQDRGYSQSSYSDRSGPSKSYQDDGPSQYGRYDQPPPPPREPEPKRDMSSRYVCFWRIFRFFAFFGFKCKI